MNTSKLVDFMAAFISQLQNDWPEGDTVVDVAVVVSVDQEADTMILTAGSDSRGWVQRAMFYEGIESLDLQAERVDREDSE